MGKCTIAVWTLAAAVSCGGDEPADVEGEYSISLTNRENGCEFMDWTEGGFGAWTISSS